MAADSMSDGGVSSGRGTHGRRGSKHRVAGLLAAQIDAGVYTIGDRLPTVRDLRTEFRVGYDTAQGAVRLLAQEGRVQIRARKGTIVVEQMAPLTPETQLKEVYTELRELQARFLEIRRAIIGVEERLGDLTDRLNSVE